ncbi:MAG TPA: hypothetical protein PLT28_10045 [Saprospiraceae bacterium]|nr:hypothetical protein [Saprospiraceae bacterium]
MCFLLCLPILSHAQEDSTHTANIRQYVDKTIRDYQSSNEKRKREASHALVPYLSKE